MATPQERALLNTIRFAEGTWLDGDPSGYRVMFGGGKTSSLSHHPDTVVSSGSYKSAAAGAYQFMPGTWGPLQQRLGLKDFGPAAQDTAALALLERRGARGLINKEGFTPDVAAKLSPEWASFPTKQGKSYYGQPVKSYEELKRFYDAQLGALSKGGATPVAAAAPSPPPATGSQGGDSFTSSLLQSMGLGDDGDFASPKPIAPMSAPRGQRMAPSFTSALLGGSVAGTFAPLVNAIMGPRGGGAGPSQGPGQEPTRMAAGGFFPSLVRAILSDQSESLGNQKSGIDLPPAPQALPSAGGLASSGGRMKVGKVAHPSQDVFPTTGPHLDVRIMKNGEYINPESARSILQHLKVGGQPLYSQQGTEWKPSYQVTSGFGPRPAPTAGASSYHRGVDYAVSHGVPLEWEGGGSYTRGPGYGQIDIPGYRIKLLHTVPG